MRGICIVRGAIILLLLVACLSAPCVSSQNYDYARAEVAGLHFIYPYDARKLQASSFVSVFVPAYGVNFTTGVRILHLYNGVDSILWMSEADPEGIIQIDPLVELKRKINTSYGDDIRAEFASVPIVGTDHFWSVGCSPMGNDSSYIFAAVAAFTNGRKTGIIIFEERRDGTQIDSWAGGLRSLSMIQVTSAEDYSFF